MVRHYSCCSAQGSKCSDTPRRQCLETNENPTHTDRDIIVELLDTERLWIQRRNNHPFFAARNYTDQCCSNVCIRFDPNSNRLSDRNALPFSNSDNHICTFRYTAGINHTGWRGSAHGILLSSGFRLGRHHSRQHDDESRRSLYQDLACT
jgi:hypothetical protein